MARSANDPLSFYLPVQKQLDRELATILKDAANEAAKMIRELAPDRSVSARVKAAQLQRIRAQLLSQSASMWGGTQTVIERNMKRAIEAAHKAMAFEDRALFQALGGLNVSEYQEAWILQSPRTLETYLARGVSKRPLSEAVYRTKALSDGWVDRAVGRGILLGMNARDLAASVKQFIRPDVPGGVSYAAFRLGRTELNNAFHQTAIDRRKDEPWVNGQKWNLSGSHPKNDDCDVYAGTSHFKGGDPGVYKPDEVPGKPHPQCLCFLTAVTVSPDEFFRKLESGGYLEYMRDKTTRAGLLPDF